MLLVQLGINSFRAVWKFANLDSSCRLFQFWQNFQTSLVLLIPNCSCHRMITYTKSSTFDTNVLLRSRFVVLTVFDQYPKGRGRALTAVQLRLSPSKAKKSNTSAKECWEQLINSLMFQRFPAAFRARIRLFRFTRGQP